MSVAVTAVCGEVLELPAGDRLASPIQPDADDTESKPEQTSDTAEQRSNEPRLTQHVLPTAVQRRTCTNRSC